MDGKCILHSNELEEFQNGMKYQNSKKFYMFHKLDDIGLRQQM